MRTRARVLVWVLAAGTLLLPLVAFGQTVRLQDGTGPNRASVNSAGALAVTLSTAGASGNNVCTSVIAINQTASATVITGVANQRIYICGIFLLSAGAQNVSVTEGTGTNCGTGAAALIGGTTASVALGANAGFVMTAGTPFMRTQTNGDNLCVLQSATSNVSGTITYAIQ